MADSTRLVVVVNRAAARARRALPFVADALARAGVAFDVREPEGPGETQTFVRAALADGYDTLAVVGGDGTLSAAASGFFQSFAEVGRGELPRPVNPSSALALLPAGTGDDFARGLSGGRRETLGPWAERLVRHARGGGSTRAVDVLCGSVSGGARRFVCLNAATFGIGAEVAARVSAQKPALRRLPGEARFALAALSSLVAWRDRRVRVSVDGGVWRECLTNIMAVANGTHAGGGMNLSPEAKVDDGLLDVLTVCGLTLPQVMREFSRIHRGGHIHNPKVRVERGERVLIETMDARDALGVEADGDVRGQTPAEFRVMPAALRVVC